MIFNIINMLFNVISLPFNSMTGEPVSADEHGYAWAKVVEQGENIEGGGRECKWEGGREGKRVRGEERRREEKRGERRRREERRGEGRNEGKKKDR